MGLTGHRGLLTVAALLLAGCNQAPAPEAGPAPVPGAQLKLTSTTLKDSRRRAQPQKGDEIRASITRLETGESGLDRRIDQWLGSLCPRNPDLKAAPPDGAEGCLKRVMQDCLAMADSLGTEPARCTYQATVKVVYNDRYLLSLSQESYSDTGGAHGLPNVTYLNIDRKTGKALALADLVSLPPATLQTLLESNLRLSLNVPPMAPLKASGFFDDRLPPTDNVAIDAEGLRFTYGAYEVAPYSMGLPNVRIPYAELAAHLAPDSPLTRMWPP